jgi:hypothetical protein
VSELRALVVGAQFQSPLTTFQRKSDQSGLATSGVEKTDDKKVLPISTRSGGLTCLKECMNEPSNSNLAAHAHSAAAMEKGNGDHLTAHELNQQADEPSINAFKLGEEF